MLLGLFFGGSVLASSTASAVYDKDILQDYVMARAIAEGVNPYLPIASLAERYLGRAPPVPRPTPSPHPPFAAIMFLPLTLLSYTDAVSAWLGIEVICLIASIYFLLRALTNRPSVALAIMVGIILLAWYPVYSELTNGQWMLVLLLLITSAVLAIRTGRLRGGGLLVGLAILIKPIPWPLLLVLALKGQWRALTTALGTIVVGFLATTAVVGVRPMISYFTTVLPAATGLYQGTSMNLSLESVGQRLFVGTSLLFDNGVSQAVVHISPVVELKPAATVVSLGLVGLALLITCWGASQHLDLEWALAVMLGVAILISPIAWSLYLVLLIFPAAKVLQSLARRRFPPRDTGIALLIAFALVIPDIVWAHLSFQLAGRALTLTSAGQPLPFAPTLPMLIPTLATTAFAGFAYLTGKREHAAQQCARPQRT